MGEKTTLTAQKKIQSWIRSSRLPGEVRERIFKFAASALSVSIQGEEGTGRDEVARAIHFLGPWKDSPFLRLSCRQLTPEKFIHRVSPWLKDQALGKKISLTLYLEQLESLDEDIQAILLDLIKNQQISWPGLEGLSFDAQVISSSTSSLAEAVSAKRFRNDLFETLEMLTIVLKPLRERKEEIPQIVSEILQERGPERTLHKKFSAEALQALQQYDWPGNLPELESLVLRSVALKEGDSLQPEDLIFRFRTWPPNFAANQTEERESWFDVTLPTLAHEIKNPLVAISTFAHLLPEKYEDPEFRQDFSRLVIQDVRRINELLENLLEFTQFSTPRITPNDLNFILVKVLEQQEKVLHQRGGQINTELGEGLPLIYFDEPQLSFALRNLLENAFSKTNQNVPLHLSTGFSREEGTGRPQEFVDINIWCDGQEGFSGSIQRVVGLETESDFQNLSLALLLVRKVMARNRGKMQVRHEGDAGMTIRLRFPITK
jgi:transcriptional regulator with AAA-type ATPase domain